MTKTHVTLFLSNMQFEKQETVQWKFLLDLEEANTRANFTFLESRFWKHPR